MLKDEQWGPWVRHYGQGMPVQAGTVVEVVTYEALNPNNGEVLSRVGVAGVDLVHSWSSQPAHMWRNSRANVLLSSRRSTTRSNIPCSRRNSDL